LEEEAAATTHDHLGWLWLLTKIYRYLAREPIRGIRVIPILVGEASMPQQTDLPKNIAALAGRNAFRIRDEDFHADVDKLAVQLVNPR
jgi:hypothetical protein